MSFASLPPSLAALSPVFHSKYTILEECGVGGSGVCLKVRRQLDGRIVVCKLIARERIGPQALVKTAHWGSVPPGLQVDTDGMLIVPTEAYVLRRVRHASCVAFIDLFADEMFYYLIMEYHGSTWRIDSGPQASYLPSPPITPPAHTSSFPPSPVEGSMPLPPAPLMRRSSSDLFECVERHRRFSEDIARYIFHQLVAVVYDLYKIGLMHRDIKDENICIGADCKVKLVDFGSCVMFDPAGPSPIQREQRFYGTCTYAAPEVLAGKAYLMVGAEVWALGLLLSVLVTGEHPFLSPADAAAGKRIPLKIPLSPEVDLLMRRCLTINPAERITLEELRAHPWVNSPRVSP
ncbi:hypothetical protein JCM10207_001300 [Rhodosporidiobolus poonsookiae]